MNDFIVQPLLLGFSVGLFCSTQCLPFAVPFMISEERSWRKNFKATLEFVAGRLGGYILFGAIFGYLGEKISGFAVDILINISLAILSVILIVYALGLLKDKGFFCSARFAQLRTKTPLLLGFFMGINVCPPFLMSLAYVFALHSAPKGIIYFFMFFLGTTVYFLPLIFIGLLGKMREFRLVARLSGLVVGFAFLIYSLYYIIRSLSVS